MYIPRERELAEQNERERERETEREREREGERERGRGVERGRERERERETPKTSTSGEAMKHEPFSDLGAVRSRCGSGLNWLRNPKQWTANACAQNP